MANTQGPTPTWSRYDEDRLRELTQRKAVFTQRARGPLWNYVNGCLPRSIVQPGISIHVEGIDNRIDNRIDKLVDWMIADADTIRDLLQPFDSGVRVAPPKSEG